jgi:nucleotide-binding universal stress UspA family protein
MAAIEDIVVGFDDSERGLDALRLGELLARTAGAKLRVARVHPELPASESRETTERLRGELAGLVRSSDPVVEPIALSGGSPARALHELAEAEPRTGLIVLGSTHRAGLGRVMPGGVAERLLSGAPCPVAVAPRGYEPDQLRVVAVGFDGSAEARAAVELAAAIGGLAEATLRVIAVGRPATAEVAGRGQPIAGAGVGGPDLDLQSELHEIASDLPAELRTLPVFERGSPVRRLRARAEQGVDLVVVGSRGYGPLRAVLLGSVSSMIVRDAPCPVLVTPRSAAG